MAETKTQTENKAENSDAKVEKKKAPSKEKNFQSGVPAGHTKLFLNIPRDGGKKMKPFDKYTSKVMYRDSVILYPHRGTIVPNKIAKMLLDTDGHIVSKIPYMGIESDREDAVKVKSQTPQGNIKDYFDARPQTRTVILNTLSELAEKSPNEMTPTEIDEAFNGLGLYEKPNSKLTYEDKFYFLEKACEAASKKV